jgi:hypothetical protein
LQQQLKAALSSLTQHCGTVPYSQETSPSRW